ncbi:hypothetical protein ACHAPT_001117 [Fusarium lateritium]
MAILDRQIDQHVGSEAYALFLCHNEFAEIPEAYNSPERLDSTLDFIDAFLSDRPAPPVDMYERQMAHQLSSRHRQVAELAALFIERCKEYAPAQVRETMDSRPVTREEMGRIQRSIYRFAICQCLLRADFDDRFLGQAVSDALFDTFSGVEVIQFTSIHDFLVREVASVFNDFAKHDIEWGKKNVSYNFGELSQPVSSVMAQGLSKAYGVIKAETHDERYEQLYNSESPLIRSTRLFLFVDSFELWCQSFQPDSTDEEDEVDEVQVHESIPPTFPDDDGGPKTAYRWALGSGLILSYHNGAAKALRRWGFVIWDEARLNQTNILDHPPLHSALPVNNGIQVDEHAMQRSWDARRCIFLRGGRGWWDEHDQSRVRWLPVTLTLVLTLFRPCNASLLGLRSLGHLQFLGDYKFQ